VLFRASRAIYSYSTGTRSTGTRFCFFKPLLALYLYE
jgi:hypothetical protein